MKGLIVDEKPYTSKSEIHKLLNQKAMDVVLVDNNTFEVNGIKYKPIEREPKSRKGATKLNSFMAMASMLAPLASMDFGSSYNRELPKGTDIIKEYGLIQNKKSKLTKWERDRVVSIFEYNYCKLD